jgi:hypothetical protein
MRLRWLTVLALPLSLAACGGSSSAPTLSVSCNGSASLEGATSIDVAPGTSGGAVLSFPDPANHGHTGTIAIAPGNKCTIGPTHYVVS